MNASEIIERGICTITQCKQKSSLALVYRFEQSIKNQYHKYPNGTINKAVHYVRSTSMLSKDRLSFVLNYSIAYVDDEIDGTKEIHKHIMQYPQMFATKSIERTLEKGITKGIIWHTQGSGRTALAFYNVKFLTDYYQKKNIIPKFYFIVDRIDLAIQASTEFSNRGLKVNFVNSKSDFVKDMQTIAAIHTQVVKQKFLNLLRGAIRFLIPALLRYILQSCAAI